MTDRLIGARVEAMADFQLVPRGTRGVIAEKAGYIGIVFDTRPWALVISHAGFPATNYVKVVEDEREPEPEQLRLFGE